MIVKYRLVEPRLAPRRTKLEVPGWAGEKQPRKDGSREQPWHCMPFSESAQYGIEVFFPYDFEVKVSRRRGGAWFEGNFGDPPREGIEWPPFTPFGPGYYTYQLLLDLKVDDGIAVRTEPHPRYYTSSNDDVPLAVPALLRTSWWPMISFVVFKTPPKGCAHVFRPGEPFMQLIFLPAMSDFELTPMSEEEAVEREIQERRIHASRDTLGLDSRWCSDTNTVFDATYHRLLRAVLERDRQSRG